MHNTIQPLKLSNNYRNINSNGKSNSLNRPSTMPVSSFCEGNSNAISYHPVFSGLFLSRYSALFKRAQCVDTQLQSNIAHAIWDDEKIIETAEAVVDMLKQKTRLNKDNVQNVVDAIIPKRMIGKISIHDITEFPAGAKVAGYSDDIIQHAYRASPAVMVHTDEKFKIFIRFNNGKKGTYVHLDSIVSIEHELIHALESCFKAEKDPLSSGLTTIGSYKKTDLFSLFSQFEKLYASLTERQVTKGAFSQEQVLSILGVDTVGKLHASFDNGIQALTGKYIKAGMMQMKTKDDSLQLFSFLQQAAHSEKIAYHTEKGYRDLFNDTDTPTSAESITFLYEEMEKFFAKKVAEIQAAD